MKTQEQQIREALRAYIIQLNDPKDGMSWVRYSVYLDSGNGLEVLWPGDCHLEGSGSKELIADQVYSNNQKYPAYHFKLGGCGYSKTHQIGLTLRAINPTIEVSTLNGTSPDRIAL